MYANGQGDPVVFMQIIFTKSFLLSFPILLPCGVAIMYLYINYQIITTMKLARVVSGHYRCHEVYAVAERSQYICICWCQFVYVVTTECTFVCFSHDVDAGHVDVNRTFLFSIGFKF